MTNKRKHSQLNLKIATHIQNSLKREGIPVDLKKLIQIADAIIPMTKRAKPSQVDITRILARTKRRLPIAKNDVAVYVVDAKAAAEKIIKKYH